MEYRLRNSKLSTKSLKPTRPSIKLHNENEHFIASGDFHGPANANSTTP